MLMEPWELHLGFETDPISIQITMTKGSVHSMQMYFTVLASTQANAKVIP